MTLDGRIMTAAIKLVRTGKRLADCERVLMREGEHGAGCFYAMLHDEWLRDKSELQGVMEQDRERVAVLPEARTGGHFGGLTWRRL